MKHIKNIKTLTETQNAQLHRKMDVGDRAGFLKETDALAAAANGSRAERNSATQEERKAMYASGAWNKRCVKTSRSGCLTD
uniref:Uncharacterized protein n=1 Tax=Peronospora matthiolae TaxID=2874970 RepID=A0AAV1UGJ6_9STRA